MSEEVIIDLEPGEDEAPLQIAPQRRSVKTEKLDVPAETLNAWVNRGQVNLQPEFQRFFVWSKPKASRLIESMLLSIPIPVVYTSESQDGIQEVVDGQQRLTAISAFINGKFPSGEPFRLTGLKVMEELNGKLFAEIPEHQDTILQSILRVIKILKDSDADVKFEVFERLNLGAEKLNDQELRNCVYRGSYNRLLRELAENDHLHKILGLAEPHVRMADRQLILRFFAMWRATHLRYSGSVKQFMNREMQAHQNASQEDIEVMRQVFKKSIELAFTVFGKNAFRRFNVGEESSPGSWETRKLNVSLWDTLLYVFSFYEKQQIVPVADRIREEFLDLMTYDATFVEYVASTGDKKDRVFYRAETWKRRVDELVREYPVEPRGFSWSLKKQLFEANPECQICHQRIMELDDAEVDHIEHYWRGGKTIPENARLVHRFCNRQRGGRD